MRTLLLFVLAATGCRAASPSESPPPRAPAVPAPAPSPALPTLAASEPAVVVRALLVDGVGAEAAARLEGQLKTASRDVFAKVKALPCPANVKPGAEGCARLDEDEVQLTLERVVAENLASRRALGITSTEATLSRQVVDYEAFKLATFTATGVFPKRYFGYLDEESDTAPYETRLKTAARTAAGVCNRWLEARGDTFRVTEQELVVTFLAEGGAILLREEQQSLESIHPVSGIGLDDIASGFSELAPLVRALDAALGTKLESIVAWRAGTPYLSRNFRFEEALAGTAAMWVWEKAIAEAKLRAKGRAGLAGRSAAEQFVVGSLVYNSGILFDERTIGAVTRLDTGAYLYELSERSKKKRWALPVLRPRASLQLLLDGSDYPEQPTSWSAVYHVLQRYGAYAALSRCSGAFDASGRLTQ